ncbi:MAG: cupin domain-containing protein [[Pasteurella] mairii]|uniref:Predicted mannose-6-phosphate isomerase n=1 Tax=[Pasteurella] mairii TaxID=757 RepID=A0A379B1X7_9PAST|nr:cupin domain-containing protein [[Pasteurella] mairii]SUB32624.1 Predicted mannose-6-phosphate isomerase [[Pasteurella] mairii]
MNIQFKKIDAFKKYDFLISCLPLQGCVELQRDMPMKEHPWHRHENNETLIILDGKMEFYYEGHSRICFPGDVIFLPKNILHGSKALEEGCNYLIAFETLEHLK